MENEVGIGTYVRDAYRIYGREVNLGRHIPSIYDGLKPVAQRLIYVTLGYKGLMKTATIIGECVGRFHPHGDKSQKGTIAGLVNNLGILKGQGNWGYSFLTGESCEPASPRYTEVMLKQNIREQITKVIPFVPKVMSEIGYEMPLYIPTPIPFALISGDQGISIGINQRIPAFIAKSLLAAYRADDPMKLESQYGYELIKDQDQLKCLWENGTGRLHLKMKTTRDPEGITIEGGSEIFSPDLKRMFDEFKWGNVEYQDLSAEVGKLRFTKAYRVRKISVEEIQQYVENASHYYCSYYIRINDGKVAQPIGMRDWIKFCYNNYSDLARKGNEAEIKKLEEKIVFYSNLESVYAELASSKKSKADVAKSKNIPLAIVNKIATKSIDYLRECNTKAEIAKCEESLKQLKNGNVEKMIDEYVEVLK